MRKDTSSQTIFFPSPKLLQHHHHPSSGVGKDAAMQGNQMQACFPSPSLRSLSRSTLHLLPKKCKYNKFSSDDEKEEEEGGKRDRILHVFETNENRRRHTAVLLPLSLKAGVASSFNKLFLVHAPKIIMHVQKIMFHKKNTKILCV